MPELPDIETYLHCLSGRVIGQPLTRVRLKSAFVLRTVDPPPAEAEGNRVLALQRLEKRR